MSDYTLYVHVVPNGKLYFGITFMPIQKRWRNSGFGYKSQQLFWRAIQKYGWDNIQHIILMENLSKDVACECEKYLIAKYQSNNPKFGYNIASGGEHNSGFHFSHTEEAKKKISEAGTGRVISAQQKAQISAAQSGKKLSQETKERISSSVLKTMTPERKAQISNSIKSAWESGRYMNRAHTNSAWNKGLTKDDPRVAKYARVAGTFHHTDETRKKISDAQRGRPAHNRKKVLCVETGIVYSSVAEAQKITGIGNISVVARNHSKTAGGYHWRYLND